MAFLLFDTSEAVCLPHSSPSLLAATGCVVPVSPSPALSSLLQEEVAVDIFSVHPPNEHWKEHSFLYFQKQAQHCLALTCAYTLVMPPLTDVFG